MTKNKAPKYTKDELKETLKKAVCFIKFEKVDGTERDMICTLMPKYLPEAKTTDLLVETVNRKENEKVIAVWDLAKKGWRSFRIDSIMEIDSATIERMKEELKDLLIEGW